MIYHDRKHFHHKEYTMMLQESVEEWRVTISHRISGEMLEAWGGTKDDMKWRFGLLRTMLQKDVDAGDDLRYITWSNADKWHVMNAGAIKTLCYIQLKNVDSLSRRYAASAPAEGLCRRCKDYLGKRLRV